MRDAAYQKHDVEGGREWKNKESKITQILFSFALAIMNVPRQGSLISWYVKANSLDSELHRRAESESGEARRQQPDISEFASSC